LVFNNELTVLVSCSHAAANRLLDSEAALLTQMRDQLLQDRAKSEVAAPEGMLDVDDEL
jgi:hypothetical protein